MVGYLFLCVRGSPSSTLRLLFRFAFKATFQLAFKIGKKILLLFLLRGPDRAHQLVHLAALGLKSYQASVEIGRLLSH